MNDQRARVPTVSTALLGSGNANPDLAAQHVAQTTPQGVGRIEIPSAVQARPPAGGSNQATIYRAELLNQLAKDNE
jgi:hypothetical protein